MVFKIGDCLEIVSSVQHPESPVHLHLSTSWSPQSPDQKTILVGPAIRVLLPSSWRKLSWKVLITAPKARVHCPENKIGTMKQLHDVFMPASISMFGGICSETYFH